MTLPCSQAGLQCLPLLPRPPEGWGSCFTPLGLPHSFVFLPLQVNLKTGVPPDSNNETCTAGAGSLLVEFGILSRLLGDSTFEWVARRAVKALWNLRSNDTGLLGGIPLLPSVGPYGLWSPFLLCLLVTLHITSSSLYHWL